MISTADDAQTNLRDLVETTLREGPLVITQNGVETAVLVSIDEWKRIHSDTENYNTQARRTLKEILLDPNGPHDIDVPPRGEYRSRPVVEFE